MSSWCCFSISLRCLRISSRLRGPVSAASVALLSLHNTAIISIEGNTQMAYYLPNSLSSYRIVVPVSRGSWKFQKAWKSWRNAIYAATKVWNRLAAGPVGGGKSRSKQSRHPFQDRYQCFHTAIYYFYWPSFKVIPLLT